MNELHKTLPLGIKLRDALAFVGTITTKPDAAQICHELIASLGDAEVTVQVPIVHVLCQSCDEFRTKAQPEIVSTFERLIQVLKAGEIQLITGTLHIAGQNPGELDRQLEKLRATMLKGR